MLGYKSDNGRFKVAVLVLLVLCALICAGTFFSKTNGNISNKYNIAAAKERYNNKSINILLLGIDEIQKDNSKNSKTKDNDTIIVVKYDGVKKWVTATSVPTDMLLKGSTKYEKISSLYTENGERSSKDAVEKLIEQPIDYVVKIDYAALKKLVDSIGGIQVDVDRDMKYDDNAKNIHISLKKGKNVQLDGEKTVQFFRWQKNNNGIGEKIDYDMRIVNQQKVLQAIISKCRTQKLLDKMPNIIDEMHKCISTDMPADKLMAYCLKVLDLKNTNVRFLTLNGTPIDYNDQFYLKYDEDGNSNIVAAMKGDAPIEVLDIKRADLKIKVLNGSRINGLAASVARKLKAKGYKQIEISNTKLTKETFIEVKDDKIKYIIATDSKIANVNNDLKNNKDYAGNDAVIILGQNYKASESK